MVIQILFCCGGKKSCGWLIGTGVCVGAINGSTKGFDNCNKSSDVLTGVEIGSELKKSTAGTLFVIADWDDDIVADDEELLKKGLLDEDGDTFCWKEE